MGERGRCHHGRGSEPSVTWRVDNARRPNGTFEQLAGVVVTAGVDGNEALHGTPLRLYGVQRDGQPTSAVMGNEHRCDDVAGADQMVGSDGRGSHTARPRGGSEI